MRVVVLSCPYPAQSLRVEPGDIVTVRLPDDVSPDEARHVLDAVVLGLKTHLGTEDSANVHVIAYSHRYEISKLDPDRMRALGWVRVDGDR